MRSLPRFRLIFAVIAAAAALALSAPRQALAETILALTQRPGHVTFMRHAWAPFEGAPKESGRSAETLGPCETQRNLDDKGRADARRIGDLFRREGLGFEHVFTSRWCRCVETAELIMGRKVDHLPLIDSYFTSPDKATRGPARIAALKRYLNEQLPADARALMVTHGSLISDLTGIDTNESEFVVVKADGNGGITVVGHGVP